MVWEKLGRESWEVSQCLQVGRPFEHWQQSLSMTLSLSGCDSELVTGSFVSAEASVASLKGSYLVDPASSHMLVSKIKPCMSKYKQIHTVKLRMAH